MKSMKIKIDLEGLLILLPFGISIRETRRTGTSIASDDGPHIIIDNHIFNKFSMVINFLH